MTVATSRAEPARERTFADRFLGVVPLLAIFFWLCVLYAVQAWRQGSPWLFGDELELSQLSRAIAATGHAARRGQPHAFDSLYTYLIAPAWRINDTHRAYDTVKYINVLVMTATAFPAYGIARFVAGKRASLYAATAATLIPALVYTGLILEESLAYPFATLCLFLIMGALLRRTRWWIAGAVLASLVTPLVGRKIIVIPVIFVLAALFVAWQSDVARAWRAHWSKQDWIGAVVLVAGVAVTLSALLGHASHEWLIATGFYKRWMFTMGLRAAGALTIGLGIFPVVVGLATLWPAPGERFRVELRVFRSVLLAALICFLLYTAVKATYLKYSFATVTVERNLIYLAPLLFAACAVWFERRRLHPAAIFLAGGAVLYLVLTTPYEMQVRFYSDAPGFSLLEWLNRTTLGLTPGGAKVLLLLVLAGTLAVLFGIRYAGRAAIVIVVVAAAFVIVWNGAGELAAASASNAFARAALSNIHGKPTWLDRADHGQPAFYLGQAIQDPTSVQLLEFWNRSLKQVWSLDGTAPGPGPIQTPDLKITDGTLYPDPGYPYVVAEPGIVFVGTPVAGHDHRAGGRFERWQLYRLNHPLRLQREVTGLYPDGWSGANGTQYTQYASPTGRGGKLIVRVSREDWSGPFRAARVEIVLGRVVIGSDKQPHVGPPFRIVRTTIEKNETKTFAVPTPGPRFRAEVAVDPTFRPIELAPQRSSDARPLGAEVTYRFVSSRRKRR